MPRHDLPCPCGSGLIYRVCCARYVERAFRDRDEAEQHELLLRVVMGWELPEALHSIEDLTQRDMEALILAPFDSPHLIQFAESIPEDADAPVIRLLDAIVRAISTTGLATTASGAFPTDFVRKVAVRLTTDQDIDHPPRPHSVHLEEDVRRLYHLRLVLEFAGIIYRDERRFVIGSEYRRLIASRGAAAVYPVIFRTFAERFTWANLDGHKELRRIQQFFCFTLFLLAKYGGRWKPQHFYTMRFLRSFPMIFSEFEPDYFGARTPAQLIESAYTLRTLHRFLAPLGLVELRRVRESGRRARYAVRALPLLEDVVQFPEWIDRV